MKQSITQVINTECGPQMVLRLTQEPAKTPVVLRRKPRITTLIVGIGRPHNPLCVATEAVAIITELREGIVQPAAITKRINLKLLTPSTVI